MNIFAKFKRNNDAINNGKLMVLGYDADSKPIGVLVARIHESNLQYEAYLNNIKKTRQTELDRIRKVDEEQFQKVIMSLTEEAISSTCIVGFVGLKDENGNDLTFTRENVDRIKCELPELYDKICAFGSDPTNYVGEFNEADSVKN